MLGMWQVVMLWIFFFVCFYATFLFSKGNAKTKEHMTQTINSLNVLFYFVVMVSAYVKA